MTFNTGNIGPVVVLQESKVLDLPSNLKWTDSFKNLGSWLEGVFEDVLPISNFLRIQWVEFVELWIHPEPKYSLEAHLRAFLSAIFVTFRLVNKETEWNQDPRSFLWWFPNHDWNRTFIINGGEQLSSQLVRSPGVCTSMIRWTRMVRLVWINCILTVGLVRAETDSTLLTHVSIRKIPFTTLVRALGFSGDDEIIDIFKGSAIGSQYNWKRYPTKNPMDSRTRWSPQKKSTSVFVQVNQRQRKLT